MLKKHRRDTVMIMHADVFPYQHTSISTLLQQTNKAPAADRGRCHVTGRRWTRCYENAKHNMSRPEPYSTPSDDDRVCLWHFDTDLLVFHMPDVPHPELLSFLPSASPPLSHGPGATAATAAAAAAAAAAAVSAATGGVKVGKGENGGGLEGRQRPVPAGWDGDGQEGSGEEAERGGSGFGEDKREVGGGEGGRVTGGRGTEDGPWQEVSNYWLPETIDGYFRHRQEKAVGLDPGVNMGGEREGGGEAYDVPSLGRAHMYVNKTDFSSTESMELDAGGLSYLWLRRYQKFSSAGPSCMSQFVPDSPLIFPYQLPWPDATASQLEAAVGGGGGGGGWGPHNYSLVALERARALLSREAAEMGKGQGGGWGAGEGYGDAFYRRFGDGGKREAFMECFRNVAVRDRLNKDPNVVERAAQGGCCAAGLGCQFHVFFDRPRLVRSGVMSMYHGHPATRHHVYDAHLPGGGGSDCGGGEGGSAHACGNEDRSTRRTRGVRGGHNGGGGGGKGEGGGRGGEGNVPIDVQEGEEWGREGAGGGGAGLRVCWLPVVHNIATYLCSPEDGEGEGRARGVWEGLLAHKLMRDGDVRSIQEVCRQMRKNLAVGREESSIPISARGFAGFIHNRCGAGQCHCLGHAQACVREAEMDSARRNSAEQSFVFAVLQHLYGSECIDCHVREHLLRHGFVFRNVL